MPNSSSNIRSARPSACSPHVLPFLVFLEKGRENHKKNQGFFLSLPTPKIPGKEGKNAQQKQGIPRKEKKQGIPKKQGKEGQGIPTLVGQTLHPPPLVALHGVATPLSRLIPQL